MSIGLEDCWAKTAADGRPALTVRDHCINVGVVAWEAKTKLPPAIADLIPNGGVGLVAAHDIGKITPGFLMKSPVWREEWQKRLGLLSSDSYASNHAIVGQHFLAGTYSRPPFWLMSVGGHHGSYCTNGTRVGTPIEEREQNHPWVTSLKRELLDEIIKLFGSLSDEKIDKSAHLHWFTGYMTFCDWIGSNTEWFPLDGTQTKPCPLTINEARQRAGDALDKIGWHRREVRQELAFTQLFQNKTHDDFKARPLQETLLKAVTTPGLYIVEAPMGEGKTEAALAAAYQRWTQGGERGLYFALPTQLTSNRIHERIGQFLANVVADRSTLALVHGNAWLSGKRLTPLSPAFPGEKDQAEEANRWFSDSRMPLLAPFGVGTIDQALMAVMPVKFSALRLFALGGKVVVMDEVHSYDPYTSALLDRTVEWLLEIGCTVIVLSATLTKARRSALVKAAGAQEEVKNDAYPLITRVTKGSSSMQEIEVIVDKPASKHVHIQNISVDSPEWEQAVIHAAESDACVVVIRNTIAFAQETYKRLKSACRDKEGIKFGLLHSRFPQFRREENEDKWMRLLGKGEEQRPEGCILVGTQVLEQSVDIDADLLITDFAPTDLILQRIGRLHRHARTRPAGYKEPRCILLHPEIDWHADAKEIKKALGPSAYVYPPFALYMSERVWGNKSVLVLPDEIRPILEESAQESSPDLPAGAQTLRDDLKQIIREMEGTASMRNVFKDVSVDDVEGSQTRWNSQSFAFIALLKSSPEIVAKQVMLNFLDGATHTVQSGPFDFELARKLHLNAVRVPYYLVADSLKSGAAPDWLKQHSPRAWG